MIGRVVDEEGKFDDDANPSDEPTRMEDIVAIGDAALALMARIGDAARATIDDTELFSGG